MGTEGLDIGPEGTAIGMKLSPTADRLAGSGGKSAVGQQLQQRAGDPGFADIRVSAGDEQRLHGLDQPRVRSYLGTAGSGTSATSFRMMSSASMPSA